MDTKTKMKHTPTPWRMSHELGEGFSIVRDVYHAEKLYPVAVAVVVAVAGYTKNYHKENEEMAKGNAAFIVKAVNCHEMLIDTLKNLSTIPCLTEMMGRGVSEDNPCYCASCQAKKAIAKAEGK